MRIPIGFNYRNDQTPENVQKLLSVEGIKEFDYEEQFAIADFYFEVDSIEELDKIAVKIDDLFPNAGLVLAPGNLEIFIGCNPMEE